MIIIEQEYTNVLDIFEKFLDTIDDRDVLLEEPVSEKQREIYLSNLQKTLFNFLETSMADEFQGFHLDIELDKDNLTIFPQLDSTQTTVLVLGMTNAWLDRHINRSRLMRASIEDRDFKESSHANHISSLIALRDSNQQRMRRMVHSWANGKVLLNK